MNRHNVDIPLPELNLAEQHNRASAVLGSLLLPRLFDDYPGMRTGESMRASTEISGTETLIAANHLAPCPQYTNLALGLLLGLSTQQGTDTDPRTGEYPGAIPDEMRMQRTIDQALKCGQITVDHVVYSRRFTNSFGQEVFGPDWHPKHDIVLCHSAITEPLYIRMAASYVEAWAKYLTRYADSASRPVPFMPSPLGKYSDAAPVLIKSILTALPSLISSTRDSDTKLAVARRTNEKASRTGTPHNSGGFLFHADGTPLDYQLPPIAPEVQAFTYEALAAVRRADEAIARACAYNENNTGHVPMDHVSIRELRRHWQIEDSDRHTIDAAMRDIQGVVLGLFVPTESGQLSAPSHLIEQDPHTGALRPSGLHGINVARLLHGGILKTGDERYIQSVVQMICDELVRLGGLSTLTRLQRRSLRMDGHSAFSVRPSHNLAVSADLYETGYYKFSRKIDERVLCMLAMAGSNVDLLFFSLNGNGRWLNPVVNYTYGLELPSYTVESLGDGELGVVCAGVLGAVQRLRAPLRRSDNTSRAAHDDAIAAEIEEREGGALTPDERIAELTRTIRLFYPEAMPPKASTVSFFAAPAQNIPMFLPEDI